MKDNIHPLIQHIPTDAGNDSIPALRVLSEITTSLSSDANVEQLLGRFLTTMIRLAGAQAVGPAPLVPEDDRVIPQIVELVAEAQAILRTGEDAQAATPALLLVDDHAPGVAREPARRSASRRSGA